jgi:hypothetical protein
MRISRRLFLQSLLSTGGAACLGQGVASRKVPTQPRPKPSGLPFGAHLTDIAATAGLSSGTIYGQMDHNDYLLEALGCGCAFLDYDGDGWMDIFLLSGTRLTEAPAATTNHLFKNNRDGTFTDVTERAGLTKQGWASGVCVGDYNNDGFEDLFITYWGQQVLYRNNGDGTFKDVTEVAGVAGNSRRWSSGCTFLDYNRDGFLDLFVSNYAVFDPAKAPKVGQGPNCQYSGMGVLCGPRGFPYGQHSLYRNNGDGTFTDISIASGVAAAKQSYGLTAVSADFDDDGWPDIYVACDSTPSLLFLNNHDGTFREEAVVRGAAYSEDGQEQAGMGLAVGDYDLDGRLDIFKTNFADDTANLYHNIGKANFEDATRRAGIGVESRFVSWGAGMVDLDNNGLPDLFVVTGNVYPNLEKRAANYPLKSPRLLFRNMGSGRFEELLDEGAPAIASPHVSRGCAFGDFDNDGDVDIVIVNLNEAPSLLRNDVSGTNSWLKVKLIGTKSNRSAIGARVTVNAGKALQTQEVMSQSSFLSASDFRLHFGLGDAKSGEVRVRWPSGTWQDIGSVAANQLVTIKEGTGVVPTIGWKR